jgi:hypothetical protein
MSASGKLNDVATDAATVGLTTVFTPLATLSATWVTARETTVGTSGAGVGVPRAGPLP